MKLGTETGSLINHLMSGAKTPAPEVGMGATVLCWTDRHAGTITKVNPDGSFEVQCDKATRIDSNGMSDAQSYSYERNPNGCTYRFARVTRGKAKGQLRENGRKDGNGVLIGTRDHHHDYSF
jgi:hypothetical protein